MIIDQAIVESIILLAPVSIGKPEPEVLIFQACGLEFPGALR